MARRVNINYGHIGMWLRWILSCRRAPTAMMMWMTVVSSSAASSSSSSAATMLSTSTSAPPLSSSTALLDNNRHLQVIQLRVRGGSESSKKKTKKKKTKKSTSPKKKDNNKAEINQVLKDTDAAQALGDAIRARADVLRQDNLTSATVADPSLASLAWSLGASDYVDESATSRRTRRKPSGDSEIGIPVEEETGDEYSGGVEVAPGAVVASYFLKSHGGAHALQSLCSLLASVAGLGAVGLAGKAPPPSSSSSSSARSLISLTLLKRSLVFALVKHVSGLLAAAWISAKAIPDVGFVQARGWMQQLALDPVSQYCFYTALVLVWLPHASTTATTSKQNGVATLATAASTARCWWQSYPIVTLLLVGPILLREVISTALVTSDVLVLLSLSSGGTGVGIKLLQVAAAMVNAGFSILVTPRVWRGGATAAQRQKVLAKLVQKCSLAFEVAVGMLMLVDALRGVMELLFAAQRPPLTNVLKRCVCANLYLQFLLTRRRKIQRLASQIRGGAAYVPGYVLDVLLDPQSAMGLKKSEENSVSRTSLILSKRRNHALSWRDYLWLAFAQDER